MNKTATHPQNLFHEIPSEIFVFKHFEIGIKLSLYGFCILFIVLELFNS